MKAIPSVFSSASLSGAKLVDSVTSSISTPEDPVIAALCPGLSMTERLKLWGVCFIFGWLITLLSLYSFPMAVIGGRPEKFGMLFSFGNLVSLIGSFFLTGPVQQWKNLTSDVRSNAFLIYIVSLISTIVVVFLPIPHFKFIPVLGLAVLQACSMVWYSLSFVPYGRATLTSCCQSCMSVFSMCCG